MKINNFIFILTAALNYNRHTECTIEVCHRVLQRIDKDYTWRVNHDFDEQSIEEDVDLLTSAIFIAYGDYGTSPRYGWIVDKRQEEDIKSALINRIKELNYYLMLEVLNDT